MWNSWDSQGSVGEPLTKVLGWFVILWWPLCNDFNRQYCQRFFGQFGKGSVWYESEIRWSRSDPQINLTNLNSNGTMCSEPRKYVSRISFSIVKRMEKFQMEIKNNETAISGYFWHVTRFLGLIFFLKESLLNKNSNFSF